MGCDIHLCVEKKLGDGTFIALEDVSVIDCRSYAVFGFLANVRNYSAVKPLSEPRGIPQDASKTTKDEHASWGCDAHSASWLSVEELVKFDYDVMMEDRRVTRQVAPGFWNGGATAEPGGGQKMTYREFLGKWFMEDLETLKSSGADRIVFWFDN